MKIAVISPPDQHAAELATVQAMFAVGLRRYHLRKPTWSEHQVEHWLEALPARMRGSVFLHSHHALASRFAVGGVHFRDEPRSPEPDRPSTGVPISRSCHDDRAVQAALGRCDAILFGPVFSSLSKQGHGPLPDHELAQLKRTLATRSKGDPYTQVFALGGVTAHRLSQCRDLGFDGVAILGAVWMAADPVAAFLEFTHANHHVDAQVNHRNPSP
jgi:thiamine-phosphate pyrophosphorylase